MLRFTQQEEVVQTLAFPVLARALAMDGSYRLCFWQVLLDQALWRWRRKPAIQQYHSAGLDFPWVLVSMFSAFIPPASCPPMMLQTAVDASKALHIIEKDGYHKTANKTMACLQPLPDE